MRAHGVLLSLLLLSPGDAQLWTAAIAGTANASGAINAVDSNSSFAYPTGAAEVRTATSSTTLSAIVADAGNNLLRGLQLQMSSTPINGAALSLYMASAVSTVAGNGTAGFADVWDGVHHPRDVQPPLGHLHFPARCNQQQIPYLGRRHGQPRGARCVVDSRRRRDQRKPQGEHANGQRHLW